MNSRRRSRAWASALAVAIAVAATGCGGDDSNDRTGTGDNETATTAPATGTASTGTTTTAPPIVTGSTTGTDTTSNDDAGGKAIVVTSPRAFDVVVDKFKLRGNANVFEGTVSYEIIRDPTQPPLLKGFTTATCGTGCRGTFGTTIKLGTKVPEGSYTLMVFEASAKDGSQLHAVPVPFTVHGTRD